MYSFYIKSKKRRNLFFSLGIVLILNVKMAKILKEKKEEKLDKFALLGQIRSR